jgi:NAD(P)-dependent dehydrogenase (short-subunit alcohol dehydrogenase family)
MAVLPDWRVKTNTSEDGSITMKKVIVITGASSGFGALAARALAKAGHVVYASMRDTKGRNTSQVEAANRFAQENQVDLRTVELDVQSQDSADAAIAQIVRENGRLDVVVHNAGHMVFGPTEAFTPEQLAHLYDVNVLSTQRVNRAALPQLRKQKQGLVIWVGSSSTNGGVPPYLAPYFAAKAAMEALTGQLRERARPVGCRDLNRDSWRIYHRHEPLRALWHP